MCNKQDNYNINKTETTTQRKRRLEKAKLKRQQKLTFEDVEVKRLRIDKSHNRRKDESIDQRQARLKIRRDCESQKKEAETLVEREIRLTKKRQLNSQSRNAETLVEREIRLKNMRQLNSQSRDAETLEQREIRLKNMRQFDSQSREVETLEQREIRLKNMRQFNSQSRDAETPEQRVIRLESMRQYTSGAIAAVNADMTTFENAINSFCDTICEICTKRCYRNQTKTYRVSANSPTYLPIELTQKTTLLLCNRCNTHVINSRRTTQPSKAYWNNLDPGVIPDVIQQLSQAEQRLIARIIPFVKVVKFAGLFGQYGFRGQAVLFAQDIFEVSEKLPNMLPRSTDNAGIVIVTEHLENLNVTREFSVSRDKLFTALQWLIANNSLYHDVIIDHNAQINENDLIRVTQLTEEVPVVNIEQQELSAYMPINQMARIIRASWNQSNNDVFTSGYAGVQCCAMVLANIVRASILTPKLWSTNTINSNMIAGDKMYLDIRLLSNNTGAYPVYQNGYLEVCNFEVIKTDFIMYDRAFSIEYDNETSLFGSLQDAVNRNNIGMTLHEALNSLFNNHQAGVLIAASKSLGVLYYDDKYYFTDSHSCGPKGVNAGNGTACVIECDTLDELVRICKRATGSRNEQYTINHIDVHPKNNIVINQDMYENEPLHVVPTHENEPLHVVPMHEVEPIPLQEIITEPHNAISNMQVIPVQTSVMVSIDCIQPDVEDELQLSKNVNQIVRKTKDNIVNEAHELKAEEFAWFYLFPYGVNGLKEERPVKITPLDYFQYRVLGRDLRFQRNDYLFYALSMYEYHRIKSNIAACGKKIEGQDGMVEDVHLYIKNLRGSAAYWRAALNDLLAQIRCLGPPTYFVTFSCNDLNWLDMRRALLIADGRPDEDPNDLDMIATQRLIEQYPVIVSRHFMIRINALMKYIKNNHEVFGGRVQDFWWRIEFQNRGSPHLHMVVWIENHPSFDTEEGIRQLDQVCSCLMPPEDSELHDLVKKIQIHHHTHTCKKNNDLTMCRFGFPRRECTETSMVAHSSDDFIRNGGRICMLKRRKEDRWVNNYNQTLLKLWKGNMDIQPCGSNEAIAYYVAKYISKSEPTQLDSSVAQAIRQIQHEESNISRKLFKVCMRIMQERQVSACECVYRLCHLNFRDSSRKCVFLNTRKPEQRYKVLKFGDSGQATGYCSNIFERYQKRPNEHANYDFNNMSLMEFAMLFEPYYAKKLEDCEESVDQVEIDQPARRRLITLTDNSKVVIRNVPAVVRVPYFMSATDPENYYYSLLLQYMPYRTESELLDEFDTAREAFLAREERLRQISEYMNLYRERDRQLENAFNQVHAFEILDTEQVQHEDVEEELPEQLMTEDQFQLAKKAINVGQREVFNYITQSVQYQMNGSNDRLRLFITGNAGTGKTFLFNLVKNQVNRCYAKQVVKVCALTGVAARLVEGSTLHTTFKFPVQKDGKIVQMPTLTGNYLRIMRQQWKDIEFLFIDEISMVPYEMLCMIDSRLKQLKNSDALFGGINVLLFGDLMQLPPVRGNQVFDQPKRLIPATHLWRLFTLIELTENMRQQGSTTFVDILNALRIGKLLAEHFVVLMEKVSTETEGEFSVEKALRIYPTNQKVNDHNKAVLEQFRAKGTVMYKIKAQDQLVDATRKTDNISMDQIIPTDINKTGGLPKELEIFVGAKVMLRSNIDVSKGLVNGAIGFITEIIWPNFRRAQMYETDVPSVRIDFGKDGVNVINPRSIQFPAKYNYGTAERRMLPMVLSWASTVHKMQGSTVDYAVVNLGSKLFADGQAYVALSRVRTLEGLRIDELDCSKLTGMRPCNTYALSEMDRMRNVQQI